MAEMADRQPNMAAKKGDPLWEPKYALLGVLTIALAVLLLDVLPHLIRNKLGDAQEAADEALS